MSGIMSIRITIAIDLLIILYIPIPIPIYSFIHYNSIDLLINPIAIYQLLLINYRIMGIRFIPPPFQLWASCGLWAREGCGKVI
jgi:hypothetical protein